MGDDQLDQAGRTPYGERSADKTRLIEFGRFAARDRKARGEGKPETFTFLGFTHYCGQRHKSGTFTVWRITAKKRMFAKLSRVPGNSVVLVIAQHDLPEPRTDFGHAITHPALKLSLDEP